MGVWGGAGQRGPKLESCWGRGQTGGPRFWAILEAHGLAYGGPMLDACWRLMGRFGARVGSMLAPVGSTWGPCWRLLGRLGVQVGVLWVETGSVLTYFGPMAYVELRLGAAGLNLAGWAVSWGQVARFWLMLAECWLYVGISYWPDFG